MSERDFDAEFAAMMVPLAAQDAELVGHYRAKMFGPDIDAPTAADDANIGGKIKIEYELGAGTYSQALGMCLAELAGVSYGVELPRG